MAKNLRKFRGYDDSDYEWDEDIRHSEQSRDRRKMKRMRNAIKQRNIDELLDIDDPY